MMWVKNLAGVASLVFSTVFLNGCAMLWHVQVGEVDSRTPNHAAWVPFEVMVSETGVSVEEAGKVAKAIGGRGGQDANQVAQFIQMFQIGPRTGNPVYTERYAEKLIYLLHEKCPSGRVTGLVSVREMRKYPVISGEIVKVTGYCLKTKG